MNKNEISKASVMAGIGAWLGMFIGPSTMISSTTSLFMIPLAKEFGMTRTVVSAVLLLSPWTVALFSPFAGRAIDKWGIRRVVLPMVVLFATANIAFFFITSLWQFIALYIFLGICTSAHSTTAYTKVMSLWFRKNRGIAISLIVALGSGLGASLSPQFVRYFIQNHGWRTAYVGLGIIIFLGLPFLFFLLHEPPNMEHHKHEQNKPLTTPTGLTRLEALKTRTFWMVAGMIFLTPMCIFGTISHSVPMLTERGFSSQLAATALSFIFIGGIIGDLTAGPLLDHINTPRIVLPFFTAALIGVTALHHVITTFPLIAGAMLFGVCQGSELGVIAYLSTRFFGLRAYGAIYGLLFMCANLGAGTGIMSMGYIRTKVGNYGPMSYIFEGAMAVVLLLICFLPRYVYQVHPERLPQLAVEGAAAE
jgi:predicted MFS family arabinose efflux permease